MLHAVADRLATPEPSVNCKNISALVLGATAVSSSGDVRSEMSSFDWDQLTEGIGCPFDSVSGEPNQYWDLIAHLNVSALCLLKNQAYRGQSILIYTSRHAIRPDQLSGSEWGDYCQDLHRAVRSLTATCHPDHINVELLGNQVPHLHWHLVPRYKNDFRWGAPIWTSALEEMHDMRISDREREVLLGEIREALK